MESIKTQVQSVQGKPLHIKKAAVIGSGVMGASIAAHLANVGIPCYLLDILPQSLSSEEENKGLTLEDPQVRNKLATTALKRLGKMKPAAFYDPSFVERITPGNVEDDLRRIQEVDWIVEVVVENLDVKKELLAKIEKHWKPGTIVTTNTSGISIEAMAEELSDEFKASFMGTHFFNPPRYMKLLEVIPHPLTDSTLLEQMVAFCEKVLGKGVVLAKDTPNFIANRIGTYGLIVSMQEMRDNGYTVDDIDAVSGPAMGRPKSATFRTLDIVGLDTFVHVARNVYEQVEDEEEKQAFALPDYVQEMVRRGWIGEKGGQGFYKKIKTDQGSEILSLDIKTLEYQPKNKVKGTSLDAAKQAKQAPNKLKALYQADDQYAKLAWDLLKKVLIYSAEKVGEIADTIVEIDQAMKWGFNWELGPFEAWDAIGLVESVKRMEKEGLTVPAWVKEWVAEGHESFYEREADQLLYVNKGELRELQTRPTHISLKDKKSKKEAVLSNSGASLIDIGDGVACLEFHSPNNAIGADILMLIQQSMDEVRKNFKGLIIANEGRNFCVGANIMQLLMEAQSGEWDEIDLIVRQFQETMYNLKYFEKPVIAAPHQMTLGGGVEVCMGADVVVPHAETYYGLVEVGVGLIPGGGGCKEMALRASNQIESIKDADLQPVVNKAFETIGLAKVSTSAHEAKKLGLLRKSDPIVLERDAQLYRAKQEVLSLTNAGYRAPIEKKIKVVGENGKAVLQMGVYMMHQAGYISDYDRFIANKLAHVIAGGSVPAGSLVSEQYLLDLEREAFISLCGEPKTQQRIQHMLTKGKPLRN
ncbi:3-hydroxyacyl-CoA dehydrogenase/enoyl-CoA hydratase family protein [Bacillus horti]|uniref:3-hydroxyacyl-CoA dehydrogenase n=1 Tax=Caldalkalibacillus horti TaxID=77523 RepID=A0ABT9VTY7_9BACI|nr:3-hydroxyacyl-CoA dehydrogenase/enoyl-CoA hydratase family protein [Bacillus horti]MDQ0164448.1 3-hydroxyacyl-CoA dehydrogenase [Bacillus horti]